MDREDLSARRSLEESTCSEQFLRTEYSELYDWLQTRPEKNRSTETCAVSTYVLSLARVRHTPLYLFQLQQLEANLAETKDTEGQQESDSPTKGSYQTSVISYARLLYTTLQYFADANFTEEVFIQIWDNTQMSFEECQCWGVAMSQLETVAPLFEQHEDSLTQNTTESDNLFEEGVQQALLAITELSDFYSGKTPLPLETILQSYSPELHTAITEWVLSQPSEKQACSDLFFANTAVEGIHALKHGSFLGKNPFYVTDYLRSSINTSPEKDTTAYEIAGATPEDLQRWRKAYPHAIFARELRFACQTLADPALEVVGEDWHNKYLSRAENLRALAETSLHTALTIINPHETLSLLCRVISQANSDDILFCFLT